MAADKNTTTGWDKASVIVQGVGSLAIVVSIAALIVGVNQFNTQQKTSIQATTAQYQQAQNLADALQQEATLQTYLNDMTTLMFDDKLGGHAPTSPEAAVLARSKTLIALNRLTDPQRKAEVVQFLYESFLIGYYDYTKGARQPPIVELHGANLEGANLSYANLRGANLSSADLRHANMFEADLRFANLRGINFGYTNLSKALLMDADLSKSNLARAAITNAQLAQAESLKGATMPDGSKHP